MAFPTRSLSLGGPCFIPRYKEEPKTFYVHFNRPPCDASKYDSSTQQGCNLLLISPVRL